MDQSTTYSPQDFVDLDHEEARTPVAGAVRTPRKTSTAAARRKRKVNREVQSNGTILSWYLNEIHKIPMLDRDQEFEVATRAREGDREARDLLVRSNLRFVVTVARRYQSYGLSLMDLINEGNMGLIKAAEKFNPDRGFHFISYAVWWIKQAILFAIQQKSHLIRLPLNRTAELRRLEEAERWLENQEDMDNNLESLATVMDMKAEDLNHLINMSRDHLSLDAPTTDGEDFTLVDNIEDARIPHPDDRLEDSDLQNDLAQCLQVLTERERNVITLRFGLNGQPIQSLQKIGKRIGLSKERIRQIEKKAIRKIRTGPGSHLLNAYIG